MHKKQLIYKIFILCSLVLSLFTFTIGVNAKGFGYRKNNNHLTPDIGSYKQEIDGTNSYYVGNTNEKVLYLTFDCGYDNGNLISILDTLEEKNVPSTFFVTGDFVKRFPDLLRLIVSKGHTVGNHTYGHKNITKLSSEEIKEEVAKLEKAYEEVTNEKISLYFRPPEGEFDKRSLTEIKNLGYHTFFWSIAYADWDTKNQKGKDHGFNEVCKQFHNGGIILLHTVSSDNKDCLGMIIDEARKQGYEFKTLATIVNE